MSIAIKDPAEKRYYRANVSQRWCIEHDNGCLISIGLTVDEDLSRSSLEWLRRNGRLTEISHEAWNHSGCQSYCVLRGHKECRW